MNKGTTLSCQSSLITGIRAGILLPTPQPNLQDRDSFLLQDDFLHSQDDEGRGKLYVYMPSDIPMWFITLKLTYCAQGNLSINTTFFKSYVKKKEDTKVYWHWISVQPISKKQFFASSVWWERSRAKHLLFQEKCCWSF